MGKLTGPLSSEKIGVVPPPPAQIPVAPEVVQTLSQLLGKNRGDRVLLDASASGILYTSSPTLKDVKVYTASAPNQAVQGDDVVCTELLCISHPDNAGRIWVRTNQAATVDNSIPLLPGDAIPFSVENLKELRALIVSNGDKLIVAYA